MIGWFTLSIQETNQWALAARCPCVMVLGIKKTTTFCWPLKCVSPLGKCPVCPITNPALGFYNVPLFEEHKKYIAFSSPFSLHEYNRLSQGLTNSPVTFMRMMMSIFSDDNVTSLLCYLHDLMVFAPSEQVALDRLELVFSCLSKHN